MSLKILSSPTDVALYVDLVRSSADKEKNSLGFLPAPAYERAAEQGNLFVAVDDNNNYSGHVMFGGMFPHGKIMQTYCVPEKRGQNIASELVEFVAEYAKKNSYLDLKTRVRDDLTKANNFYEKAGFLTVYQVKGGATRGRMINIRVRELDTPSLFDSLSLRTSIDAASSAFRLGAQDIAPTYAIDLNVLFDVGKRRAPKEEAGRVLAAGLRGEVRLVVAEEFVKELERTADHDDTDWYGQIAKHCKRLPEPAESEIEPLVSKLSEIIFPEKFQENALKARDRSDVLHLATAIHYEITGFITSDETILRSRREMFNRWKIHVLSASDFADLASDSDVPLRTNSAAVDGVKLETKEYNSSLNDEIRTFLLGHRMKTQTISEIIAGDDAPGEPGGLLIAADSETVLFAHWRILANPRRFMSLFICMNEQQKNRRLVLDYALGQIFEYAGAGKPARIDVKLLHGHALTRAALLARGFQAAPEQQTMPGSTMKKALLGGPLTAQNWADSRISLKALVGVGLPDEIPDYEGGAQTVKVDIEGRALEAPLFDLETVLSPGLILLPGRSGVIVPIQKKYADDLFGTSPQYSLFDSHQAKLWYERTYYCTPRAPERFKRGTPVLFYESGKSKGKGRSAVVVCARVTSAQILTNEQTNHGIEETGVLNDEEFKNLRLDKKRLVVQFDNVLRFPQPVSYKRLKEIGCVSDAQLVSAEPIGYEHLLQVIEQGFSNK